MKRALKKDIYEMTEGYYQDTIENFKRRRALASFSATSLDTGSRLFFERILSVRKIREFVFIPKTRSKSR